MPKINAEQLAAACVAFEHKPLNAAEDTPQERLKWLKTQPHTLAFEGKDYPASEIELDEASPRKTFSIPSAVKPKGEDRPGADDEAVKARITAEVAAQVKALGFQVVNGRPVPVDPNANRAKVLSSPEQREYKDRIARRQAFFENTEQAIMAKHWLGNLIANACGNFDRAADERKKFLELHETVCGKAYSTSSPTAGQALMPEAFVPDLIRNVTEAGVARKLARVVPMPEAQLIYPRRTGGLTAYFPAENVAATASNATYDNVTLTAKTAVILAQASEQTLADSGLPFVDITMQEMATTQAQLEDDCLLTGQGTSTYGGMVGFENTTNYAATAATAGNQVTGATTADAHTAAQIALAIATVPYYARNGMVITCSHFQAANIFNRLSVSTPGGLLMKELIGYGLVQSWNGIPIIENNSMNVVNDAGATARGLGFTAGDQIDFLIGNFQRAAMFGDRGQYEVAISRERYFDAYAVAIRSVARFHINVHSIGTASTAGPVIAFMQT
jgi:HK97 family phage major capsid protein